jgi:hypothetical protein
MRKVERLGGEVLDKKLMQTHGGGYRTNNDSVIGFLLSW